MALGTAPRGRAGGNAGGVLVGKVTRVTGEGPYVELPRVAQGYEYGPLLTGATVEAGDTVVVMPLAHDPDSFVVLGVQDPPATAPADHNHDGTYAPVGHDHDARYYTEAEVDAKIAAAVATATADPGLVGDIKWTAAATMSSKWMRADGTVLNRAEHPDLFAKIGTTYNTGGELATEFRLPNLTGRVPVAYQAGDADFGTLGKTAGAKTVTLTVGQLPSHTHTGPSHSHGVNDPGHQHPLWSHTFNWGAYYGGSTVYAANAIATAGSPPSNNLSTQQGTHNYSQVSGTGVSIQNGGTGNTGATGNGDAVSIVQPYTVLNALIRVLP